MGSYIHMTSDQDQKTDLEIQREIEALSLGAKIRKLRRRRSLTLQEVSNICGLSKSLLSQIENEATAPPIATLVRIAKALGVTIGYFFKENQTARRISVVRKNQRYQFEGLPHNRPEQSGYLYQALTRPIDHQKMEPFWVEFQPRNPGEVPSYHHIGEEFIHVQEGCLEFKGADQTIVLHAGDSLYFDSSIPHAVRSLDNKPAKAVVVIYAPD